ncbi:hypothetical protein THAOC_19700 [Thalassiosira oceanica]|uniref:Uncharacterized protein n=1 Tax=Thalassiosira oceanica TaxID=159749 RepID=K0S568_THAOC|nr:hypothetical protein THAOC_19700 [Thalassiosira oceanica]|eukprot:EJK60019.1 hypothetical protein THAOC_19700 [Thalassiosira oceanica]
MPDAVAPVLSGDVLGMPQLRHPVMSVSGLIRPQSARTDARGAVPLMLMLKLASSRTQKAQAHQWQGTVSFPKVVTGWVRI